MKNIKPVMQRELNGYFCSPIAYAVITIFLLVLGIFFLILTFIPGNESSLRPIFQLVMPIILLIFLPVLSMRLISEELRSGTIETLMTAPVSETDVVLGKFIGAFLFYMVMLATTLVYAVILSVYGQVDWGLILSSYIGLLLLGGLYLAVGIFFSACTKNQIISVICTIILLLILTFMVKVLALKQTGGVGLLLHHLSIREHFDDFTRGLVDTNHLVFFLTTTGLFLFLTAKVLESRRWR